MQKKITTHMPRPNPTPEPEWAVLDHLPMVRFLARRIHGRLPRHIDVEDLYSAGVVGLLEAFAKFNPAKSVRFASFASFRVRGAILDSLRVVDWAPRGMRRKGRVVQEAIRTLTSRLRQEPAEDEVAAELKTSLPAYQKLLGDLDGLEIGSLHRTRTDGSGDEELVYVPARPEDDPLFRCMRSDLVERLSKAIEDLSEQERLVTTLYYYEELTRKEIGLALGLDANRISQIRASAVMHLRSALSDLSLQANPNRVPLASRTVTTPEFDLLAKSAA
jgi:RNA polymerase sigma factor FliA